MVRWPWTARTHASMAAMYASVTQREPPNKADSFTGDLATPSMLVHDRWMNTMTLVRRNERPLRVTAPMPTKAMATATPRRSLLLDGTENEFFWPAHAKK